MIKLKLKNMCVQRYFINNININLLTNIQGIFIHIVYIYLYCVRPYLGKCNVNYTHLEIDTSSTTTTVTTISKKVLLVHSLFELGKAVILLDHC